MFMVAICHYIKAKKEGSGKKLEMKMRDKNKSRLCSLDCHGKATKLWPCLCI
jgi:hypothetical protein